MHAHFSLASMFYLSRNFVQVYKSVTADGETRRYDGLGDGILNHDDRVLFTHEFLQSYWDQSTNGRISGKGYFRSIASSWKKALKPFKGDTLTTGQHTLATGQLARARARAFSQMHAHWSTFVCLLSSHMRTRVSHALVYGCSHTLVLTTLLSACRNPDCRRKARTSQSAQSCRRILAKLL